MPVIPANADMSSDLDGMYDEEPASAPPSEDKSEAAPTTDIIDKALLAGKEVKPGDRIILEVVATHGNEVEVKYASEESAEPEGEMGEDEQLTELAR